MKFEILGSCCGNCDKLMAITQDVVSDSRSRTRRS